MTITKKEIREIMDRPDVKFVMFALSRYDSRYIGNVPYKVARELFEKDGIKI